MFTLDKTLQYINQALNYPALSYTDVSLYFDSAISELNTTLHTDIPLVSKMISDFRQHVFNNNANAVYLTEDPKVYMNIPIGMSSTKDYYYDSFLKIFKKKIQETGEWVDCDTLLGIYMRNGVAEHYQAVVWVDNPVWQSVTPESLDNCDLEVYLPKDWIMLWLIPYVCFKYTVRDGGTATVFAEELTQGFQQLQETYNVPEKVILATCADKEAYTEIVKKHLPNLNVQIRTKAIYDSMKHDRALNGVFGSFYDRGGF